METVVNSEMNNVIAYTAKDMEQKSSEDDEMRLLKERIAHHSNLTNE